jgi:hypothetical protein
VAKVLRAVSERYASHGAGRSLIDHKGRDVPNKEITWPSPAKLRRWPWTGRVTGTGHRDGYSSLADFSVIDGSSLGGQED